VRCECGVTGVFVAMLPCCHVANRLETIMDSDRIMVMDQGVVVEFDTPLNLLNIGNAGILYGLCEATGAMPHLRDIAEQHAAGAQ